MSMPGLDAVGRPVVGQINTGPAPALVPVLSDVTQEQPQLRGNRDRGYRIALAASGEFREIIPIIPSFGWFGNLSTPTTRPKLAAYQQQAFTIDAAYNFIPKFFFQPFSEPARTRPRLREGAQQFLAYGSQRPLVSFGWFGNLSDPVRIKPGLRASLQQTFAIDTAVIPVTKLINWFGNLSDPVRVKPGLKAALQQFYTGPPQLRPNPAISGVMNALETPDVFLGGVTVWNAINSGEIGMTVILAPGGEAGISSNDGKPPVASASVAIVIL